MQKIMSKKYYAIIGVVLVCLSIVGYKAGWLGGGSKTQAAQAVTVKAVQVQQQDARISYEFVGQVKAKDEVKILSKVGGVVVAKMVQGGAVVTKGQPLFRIDDKQYQSAIRSAQATLNKSRATVANSRRDLERYEYLGSVQGVSMQTLDSYRSQVEQNEADVAMNEANLQEALENREDTLIVSPVDGRIDVNDVSVGQFVVAGSTALGTVSSLDPVWVQFSMSENEYLKLVRQGNGLLPESFRSQLKLQLGDGSIYPEMGQVEQVDKGVSDTTGTITLKAAFTNPQRMLLPGLFAKIVAQGELRPNALLVPQRAVKEMLDNTFVTVATESNTAESRPVKLGEKVGNWYIVESGLAAGDRVVVEGVDKVKQGAQMAVTLLSPESI
nr:efflux RND transporter periplasmic adaptor subunit [uncultured Anaeromusa sp.]